VCKGCPGTWEVRSSPCAQADCGPSANQTRGPTAEHPWRSGAMSTKPRMHTGYRQAKATKRVGKGDRKSDRLIVPPTTGNCHPRDPCEGRGRRIMDPLE